MKVYKDRFGTGDIMFSDASKIQVVGDFLYEIESKNITEDFNISEAIIGGNASAEEAAEKVENVAKVGIQLVISNNLILAKQTKSEFKDYMHKHILTLLGAIRRENEASVDKFKKVAQSLMKKVLNSYADYDMYTSANANFNYGETECAFLLLTYREDGTPYFTGFKADFIEEIL